MPITHEQIVAEARSWIDTPFRHGGQLKGKDGGCDCAGLIIGVFSAVNLMPVIKLPVYGPDWFRHATNPEKYIVETAKLYFDEVKEPQAGDLEVLFMGKAWAHCCIVTGKNTAVEAWPIRAKVSEINVTEERIHKNRAKRYFRPKKL